MLAPAKFLFGGIVLIILGMVVATNDDLGWYPPTVFIGIGLLMVIAALVVILEIPILPRSVDSSRSAYVVVFCGQCSSTYAYPIVVQSPGELLYFVNKSAGDDPSTPFVKECRKRLRPIPCPFCGFYQPHMGSMVRWKGVHALQIIGAALC